MRIECDRVESDLICIQDKYSKALYSLIIIFKKHETNAHTRESSNNNLFIFFSDRGNFQIQF